MKKALLILSVLLGSNCMSQTKITTNNKLIIPHGDITLYLSDDTCTMVSKHILPYNKFNKIGSVPRDNHWFQDTYKGKYTKNSFVRTGYDLGHLTPSSITTYDTTTNHNSFSMFNEAPQLAKFNEHPWKELEIDVEDTIAKYKSDAIIITGVIYDMKVKNYLPNSRIRIPTHYFKVLVINKKSWYWIGSNYNGGILTTDLSELNKIFKKNKMGLIIK